MRKLLIYIAAIPILGLIGCGNSSTAESAPPGMVETPATLEELEKNYQNYKGTGPISEVNLNGEIDNSEAEEGKKVFEAKCTACHKTDKRFIGPAITGITKRRSPEWIMNMILNPEGMVKEDPIGKLLFIEYNGSPMANQNLTEPEARQVLEYFRTLSE